MTKLSIASITFEWTLRRIFPKDDGAWLKRFRRRIYYPILSAWGDYGYCTVRDEEGREIEGAKMKMTRFILWMIRGNIHYVYRWIYVGSGLAPWICKRYGHKLVDRSSAGPESGNADHDCSRCGEYWHWPLY
jgi:hypothetical protein